MSFMKYKIITPEILGRWHEAMQSLGVPKEAYSPDVRVVESGGNSFGLIFNPYRAQRPLDSAKNASDCPLCGALSQSTNLDRTNSLPGYSVIANKFPAMEGHSLAITSGSGDKEKPMYSTKDLNKLTSDLKDIFDFCNSTGFQAFHNGPGAGASVPNHEHWHLTNWGSIFSKANQVYGFESSQLETLSASPQVSKMPAFPFANLVFQHDSPDRIVHFLKSLENTIGQDYTIGTIPHAICQGQRGILVVPYKVPLQKGSIGSGDVAGHIVLKDKSEFSSATYDFCINRLGSQLFKSHEINLEKLV